MFFLLFGLFLSISGSEKACTSYPVSKVGPCGVSCNNFGDPARGGRYGDYFFILFNNQNVFARNVSGEMLEWETTSPMR